MLSEWALGQMLWGMKGMDLIWNTSRATVPCACWSACFFTWVNRGWENMSKIGKYVYTEKHTHKLISHTKKEIYITLSYWIVLMSTAFYSWTLEPLSGSPKRFPDQECSDKVSLLVHNPPLPRGCLQGKKLRQSGNTDHFQSRARTKWDVAVNMRREQWYWSVLPKKPLH